MKRNDLEPGAVSSDDDSRHDDFDNNSDDFDDASSLNSLVSLLAHRRQSFSETAATFSTLSVNESRAQGGVSINSGSALNGNGYSTASKSRGTSLVTSTHSSSCSTANAFQLPQCPIATLTSEARPPTPPSAPAGPRRPQPRLQTRSRPASTRTRAALRRIFVLVPSRLPPRAPTP